MLLEQALVLTAQDLDLLLDEDDLLMKCGELGLELAGVGLGVLKVLFLLGDALVKGEMPLLGVARLAQHVAQ
ncbi:MULTISPECIES: hypothetical protein [unclassified Streptomyces]|uniref:hypothetical protein n=1 Tax=unclassified Streptomyces TaxID=2593676 RepID=UPI00093A5F59|nr:hypothetical protein [Streptomyces sp. CB02058]OKI85909.1 hypothetical protein AMK10_35575 [Streptomyces sp. CB02058]